ncbi:MAG: MerR family transcriptional regulator, partial [Sphingopyxis sp.]
PVRPKRNVADYDESHVQAIQAVRNLQRNDGLTLPQIKALLQGRESTRRVEAGAFRNLQALVAARIGLDDGNQILVANMVDAWPHAVDDARILAQIGAIELLDTADGPAISITDSRIVTIWGEMRKAGLTEDIGFHPGMLAFYLEPAESIASQEASLFLERTEGKMDEGVAAEILEEALRGMLDFFGLLRVKFFLRHINRHRATSAPATSRRRTPRVKGPPK